MELTIQLIATRHAASQRSALPRYSALRSATPLNVMDKKLTLRRAMQRFTTLRAAPLHCASHRTATQRHSTPANRGNMTQTAKRFEQSAPTALLIAFLSKVADHSVITYAQLSEESHVDVQHKGRHHLIRAIIRLRRDQSMVFITERDVGVKLANDAERSAVLGSRIRHIHRSARSGREIGSYADLDKLSNRERLMHMTNDALLGLQEQSSRPIVQKRLEAEFEKATPKSIEAQELLRLSGVKSIS